jgi:hypothetical protein
MPPFDKAPFVEAAVRSALARRLRRAGRGGDRSPD